MPPKSKKNAPVTAPTTDAISARQPPEERSTVADFNSMPTPDLYKAILDRITDPLVDQMLRELFGRFPGETVEKIEEEKRGRSIVLSGVKESSPTLRPSQRQKDLEDKVDAILDVLDMECRPVEIRRMGRFDLSRPRLVKVVFSNKQEWSQALAQARLLRSTSFSDVYIRRSMTENERRREYELRQQMCDIYKTGTDEHLAGAETYKLLRDEVVSGCERKICESFKNSRMVSKAIPPIHDVQADLTVTSALLAEERETPVPRTGWEYFSETKMYYKLVNKEKRFDEARAFCQKKNGDLVSIQSEELNDLLIGLLEKDQNEVWSGMRLENVHGGNFSANWTDGSEINYTNFGSNEPSLILEKGVTQSCVLIYEDGFWHDHSCAQAWPFICQIKV
ncbi:lectin C-type domain protein [Ancylostoma ceylanicum]|uniref:Lectin C-type domain protein n=1 Tax=Ancylostoma ceylanicum TaxID=53326 RepID=A0A0D6LZA3_9BILA|nr:lectin C-type domain protein [Ancylostoma ceylanicum]